jgi:hypothetical protein
VGGEFVVNGYTTGFQAWSDVAIDADGDFVIVWGSPGQDGSGQGIFGRRFSASGASGPEFQVNTYTTGDQIYPSVGSDGAGNFVVSWHVLSLPSPSTSARRFAGGLSPALLAVDASAGPSSDGNRVFEAAETVNVAPSWLNADFAARTFSGIASAFAGPGSPGDPTYTIADASAGYGTVATGATGSCTVTGNCYALGITVPTNRPAPHWDAAFTETLTPASLGAVKRWTVHVGESFADVPRANPYYRFIETLLHAGVTGGCSATAYCPAASTTREAMAVFVLVASDPLVDPPACTTPVFADVPASSPFCRWIEELARRGVAGGCGGGNYCPAAAVTRDAMAVFVLRTLDPQLNPPACGVPVFADVPASSPFCRWIEELAQRGVVTGCGGGNYCPAAAVTREQMAVFLTVTFGLALYGP